MYVPGVCSQNLKQIFNVKKLKMYLYPFYGLALRISQLKLRFPDFVLDDKFDTDAFVKFINGQCEVDIEGTVSHFDSNNEILTLGAELDNFKETEDGLLEIVEPDMRETAGNINEIEGMGLIVKFLEKKGLSDLKPKLLICVSGN